MLTTQMLPKRVIASVSFWTAVDSANDFKIRLVSVNCTDMPQNTIHTIRSKSIAEGATVTPVVHHH